MRLVAYVHRHAKALLFTVALLVVSGAAVLLRMPVSLFPDVTFPRIVILADNGEEPPERMMVEVTKPLEDLAASIPGVLVVRSITGRGSTEISLGLAWSANVDGVLQMLQGRIGSIRTSLPASASIHAEQMTVSVFPILGYSLTSDSLDLVTLRDIALYRIRPALLRVGGVAKVDVIGGDTREYAVTVSPARLAAYHLSITQVADAIERTNAIASAGLLNDNYRMYLTLVSGLLHGPDDIRSVVIAVQNGVPVRVGDVADVTPSTTDRLIRTTAHGKDAVLVSILKHPTGSTVQIGKDVNAEIAWLSLPKGVRFETFYDQGDFISGAILGTRDSIALGVMLSMVVLLIFLRNWKLTLVMVLVVPATVAVTVLCLDLFGLSINIMSLGGIAAAVGLIIDDAIVVIEYMLMRLGHHRLSSVDAGGSIREASGATIKELMPAIVGSTASTIVIHIPLAFLGGIVGAFFASLSITMVVAMLVSFLFSITLAPLLAAFLLRESDLHHEVARMESAGGLGSWYDDTMNFLFRHRSAALLVTLALMFVPVLLYRSIGNSFLPDMDEGSFVLDYASPPGSSLDETNRMLKGVESILMSIPEVAAYSRRTGTEMGFFLTEPNTGDIMVRLHKERKRGIEEVINEVRSRVEGSQPSLRIEFGQLMMDVVGDLTNNPSPVEVKLFGENKTLVEQTAREVKTVVESVPGVVDAFDGIVVSGPAVVVTVDPTRAALAGVSTTEVRDQLEAFVHGRAETNIQSGEKLLPVRVRFPASYHSDLEVLQHATIVNANGTIIPLVAVASLDRVAGQTEIHRERLRQMVAVTARVSGRDLGSTMDDLKARLATSVVLPQGVSMEFGGVYQEQQESFRGLLIVALAAFLLVFLVLLIEFGEFAVPFAIFVVNILSLIGVFGALWLTGVSFNVSSFVGIVMVIGIVAENAIFVMHQAFRPLEPGMTLEQALIWAGKLRGRPIMMTTLAATLALLPLALGIGTGAQMQQPLAVAVIGGFCVSSILVFLGLPLYYLTFSTGIRTGRAR